MATSGSVDYSESLSTLIRDAYIDAGVLDAEADSLTGQQERDARRMLNRMIKSWQAEGWNLWRLKTTSFTLTASTASYQCGGTGSPVLADRPLRIHEARWRNSSGTDLTMTELSRTDYFRLPDKTVTGTPTNYYYDPGRNQGTFYVWPVPTADTATTIQLTYERTIEDLDANANEPDFPQEWFQVLVYGLSAMIYKAHFQQDLSGFMTRMQLAEALLERVEGFDRETAGTVFLRDMGRHEGM